MCLVKRTYRSAFRIPYDSVQLYTKVLVSKFLSCQGNIRIYKTVIRPILVVVRLGHSHLKKGTNLVNEKQVLWKISGQFNKKIVSTLIVRTNAKIKKLVVQPNIIGETKAHRLRWLGHLERMGDNRNVERAYMRRPTGRRPVDHLRCRWSDAVEADLRKVQAVN